MHTSWIIAAVAGSALAAQGPNMGLAGLWMPASAMGQSAPQEQADQADEDDEMLQEMMILAIPRESAAYFATLMGFDELQRELAMDIHREYHGKYRDAAVVMRDLMEKSEEAMGENYENFEKVMAETMRAALGFLDRVIALGDEFIHDLAALATDNNQKAAHQRVIGAHQREMAVAMSGMNGGGEGVIDLIRIGRDLDPPLLPAEGDDAAAQALYEYEREVDALCGPMVQKAIEAFRAMAKAMSEGDMSEAIQEQLEKDMAQLTERFNAANERAVRRVHQALPEHRRAEWDLAYKRARWPEIYEPNDFHRTQESALKSEGLTAQQRDAIDAALVQYTREAEPANQKWATARAEFLAFQRSMGFDWNEAKWEEYQAKTQAIEDARAVREALDQRFIDRVLQTLTPAQRDAMPKTTGGIDVDEVLRRFDGG